MKFSPRSILGLGIPLVITVGSLVALSLVIFPSIHARRVTLDQSRTSLLALQQQETNLEFVRRQLTDVEDFQVKLDSHIWGFDDEEEFFERWEGFTKQFQVEVTGPTVAEVVPTGDLINRAGSITLAGTPNQVLSALAAIPAFEPLVGITGVHITSPEAGQISARVEFTTVWH